MKLNINIKEDKELRAYIKDMIKGQIKSQLRTHMKEVVKEAAEGRWLKDFSAEVMIKEIAKDHIERALANSREFEHANQREIIPKIVKEAAYKLVKETMAAGVKK